MVSQDLIHITAESALKLATSFPLYFTLHLYSKLEENKHRFVNHWNKEHTNLVRADYTSRVNSTQEQYNRC